MKVEEFEGGGFRGLINVAQLLKEPVGSSCRYYIGDIVEGSFKSFIEGWVMLIRSGQGILARAELTAEVELVCSRCLNVFSCPISFNIEEEFLPAKEESVASSQEGGGAGLLNSGLTLDLGEVIRQYILLNLPMKPLCRADCPGIEEVNSYGSA